MPDMTPRQEAFAREYVIDLNATQAAIRAGYSPKTADVQGPRLLGYARVAALISDLRLQKARKLDLSADRVLTELARIGFSDIRKAVRWSGQDPETGEAATTTLSLVDSDALDDDTAASISEIAETRQGLKLKLYDKKGALELLGRHLGLFEAETGPQQVVNFIVEGHPKGDLNVAVQVNGSKGGPRE